MDTAFAFCYVARFLTCRLRPTGQSGFVRSPPLPTDGRAGAFKGERPLVQIFVRENNVDQALKALKKPCEVTLTTDSKYVVDAITLGWAKKWRENNWMRNKKDKALNPDLWEELLDLLEIHDVTFRWVKGHAGHSYNERCDRLAVAYYSNLKD